MKILFDARALEKHIDGIGRYSLGVMRALTTERNDWKYSVLVGPEASKHLEDLPVEPIVSDVQRFRSGENGSLTPMINASESDVYLNFSMAGPCPSIPTLITVHDLMVLNLPGYFGSGLLMNVISKVFFRNRLKQSIRHASAISVPSKATLEELEKTFQGAGEKAFITGEGQTLFASETGTGPDFPRENFLLYVGNARAYKNLTRLVVAYARLRAMNPAFPEITMVVRKDRAFRDFMRDVEECSATNSITVLSHVSDEKLKELYSKCIGLVMPSLQEGFGLPALEAMAGGAPVMISSGTALEELAGPAGIPVDPTSVTDIMHGMALLTSQPELRRDLSKKAIVQSRKFSWSRTAFIIAEKIEEIAI